MSFNSVSRSVVTNSLRPHGLPVHHQLLEFAQTHAHPVRMPSTHLIFCRPLLLLPSIFAPPGSQASSRGEAKDSALLSSRDADLW